MSGRGNENFWTEEISDFEKVEKEPAGCEYIIFQDNEEEDEEEVVEGKDFGTLISIEDIPDDMLETLDNLNVADWSHWDEMEDGEFDGSSGRWGVSNRSVSIHVQMNELNQHCMVPTWEGDGLQEGPPFSIVGFYHYCAIRSLLPFRHIDFHWLKGYRNSKDE